MTMTKSRTNWSWVIFFFCVARLFTFEMRAQEHKIRVPEAKYLFGLSAAPIGDAVLLNSSTEAPEGEAISGSPTVVRIGEDSSISRLRLPNTSDQATIAVWDPNTNKAFIETDDGIYIFDSATGQTSPIVLGVFAGLAISPDGSRLAFWDLEGGDGGSTKGYALVVFDIELKSAVRKWKLPVRYEADQYGHEIVFSGDGMSVYARTYDIEGRTPLKRFDLKDGQIQTLWEDCIGLSSNNRNIYFAGGDHGSVGFYRIAAKSGLPERIISNFAFSSLLNSGTKRWIVAANNKNKRLAVYDTRTNALLNIDPSCQSATVQADGNVVCARGGEIFKSLNLLK